jgi:hypothetical protein
MAPPSDDEWTELIDASPSLTKKSKESYKKHMRQLLKAAAPAGIGSLSAVMFNFERVFPLLQRLPPNIRRSHIAAVLSLFKRGEEAKHFRRVDPMVHTQHRLWLEALAACNNANRQRIDDNLPTDREIESSATMREWHDANNFMQETDPRSQEALLVAFHALALPPLRGNDLAHVRIGYQPHGNYFMVRPDGSGELVIRDHKSARYYPRLERQVPLQVVHMVERSVKRQPRNWLFSTKSGTEFSDSGYQKWKSLAFLTAFRGKRVTNNSLRHAYISERVHGNPNLSTNQARSIAASMGHSLDTQRQYVRLRPQGPRF